MKAAHSKSARRTTAGRAKTSRPDERQWRGVPHSASTPKRVFVLCRYCAYSPAEIPSDGVCPKCGGGSWQRYALPEKALESRDD